MADIGSLIIKIKADASELEKTFDNLGGSAKQFERAMDNISKTVTTAFFTAVTAFAAMTIEAGRTAEQTEKLTQKSGIASSSIEGMTVIMNRNGLSAQSMTMAVKGLATEMVGVQQGAKASIDTFNTLGISLDVVDKGMGATLRAIADKFQVLPDGAMKAKLAVDLFGKAGLDWIPILNKGSVAIDASMKKAAEFGLILTDIARSQLTEFDDGLDDLQSALKGFAMQVGVAFTPAAISIIHAMTDAVVFAKDVFNAFADAGAKLVIRLGAMVASIQILSKTLFSLKAFSKEAWEETLNHVKAIDQWAVEQLKAVDVTRAQEKSLSDLAMKQLGAGGAAISHAVDQQKLGQHIVSTTKIFLAQQEVLGKAQERMGAGIVSAAGITQAIQAREKAEDAARQRRLAEAIISEAQITMNIEEQEGKRQERLGARIVEEAQLADQRAKTWAQSYQEQETAFLDWIMVERVAQGKNEEQLGRFIVAQSQAALKLKGFWETQLDALVNSNKFSVGLIVNTWTSGIANSIVRGGNFVKAAWEQTQIALIQGGLNLTIQWVAQQAQMALASSVAAGTTTAVWSGAATAIMGYFATVKMAFTSMMVSLVAIMKAVGVFIMGVLTAIGKALGFTGFGAPLAGAILAGVVLIAAALAATGNLGFRRGGIGDFGEGTPAMLHGPEAIIPLRGQGIKMLRDSLVGSDGVGQEVVIKVPVTLEGRQIAFATARHTPAAWRNRGAPA